MKLRSDVVSALTVTLGIAFAVHADVGDEPTVRPAVAAVHTEVSFSGEVLPLLEKHCWECHSEQSSELGLKLDTYEGVMAGSDYGTVIEPGDPDGSLLIDMIQSGDMPEDGDPVPADEIEVIRNWIAEGAVNN
jgi:hypothetical protein